MITQPIKGVKGKAVKKLLKDFTHTYTSSQNNRRTLEGKPAVTKDWGRRSTVFMDICSTAFKGDHLSI